MLYIFFFQDGIGAFKIYDKGIRVQGKSEFEKAVQFTKLSTLQVVNFKN